MGLEFADDILAERRHRCTINASKKNRLDFPNIGHYDTWMIDALQNVVERNHNTLLYETWTNASDYAQTAECFGFVTLASPELQEQINSIVQLPEDYKMPPSLKFLSERIGCKIAPQPWSTTEEIKKIFPKLLLAAQQACQKDEDAMDDHICNAILPYVNGTTVTPKLPVYCRLFRKRYSHNRRVRDAAKSMVVESGGLSAVNILTSTQPLQADSLSDNEMVAEIPAIDIHHAAINAHNSASLSPQLDHPILQTPNPSTEKNYINIHFGQRMMKPMPAMMPTRFPMIDRNNFQPLYATTFVGGMPISSGYPSSLSFDTMRRNNPSRGHDKVSVRKPRNPSRRHDKVSLRKPRTCKNCKLTDCEAAKPGKGASGLKRTCSQSPSA
jgi:hypothetical protein